MLQHLINSKIVTGPLEKNTSYSGLESLRKYIFGLPQFKGGESFLKFGNGLHEPFLQNKWDTYKELSAWEKQLIDLMLVKLAEHPVVQKLMRGAKCEDKKYKKLMGVLMAYILDIKNNKIGADLKTTSCATYQECLKKAIEYGYVKQGRIYMRLENLTEFYFIFIRKQSPYDIYIISYKELKPFEKYADAELEFLLYFYKKYGHFMTEEDKLK